MTGAGVTGVRGGDGVDVHGSGYFRFPTISGDTVVFVSEDDLWTVPASGGRAWRLTAGVAEATHPRLSPDGTRVAYVGREEGPAEVYVMPAAGGMARRLTFHGADTIVIGWADADTILYATNGQRPFRRDFRLHRISAAGGRPEPLPYGLGTTLSYGPGGGVVLGRNHNDPARWKRYRGGTAGTIWVDADRSGEFVRLVDLDGNLANPCWVGDRIFFLSDHEGIGNVYSTTSEGTDLRRHTDHGEFYARNLASDGRRLVYQCAADIYLLEPDADQPVRIPIEAGSARTQRNRRFVPAADYLEHAVLGPDGSDLALTTRGKAFSMANWEGPVRQHGERDGVRYRLVSWLSDHRRLVASAGDESEDEYLVVLTADGSEAPRVLRGLDVGRPVELLPSPHGARVAITNHRNELLLVDLDGDPEARRLDHSEYGRIIDPDWSPDGRWLAYSRPVSAQTRVIALCDVESGESHAATTPVLRDRCPSFDPDGKYLYFLGQREFDPVYDTLQFELSFPLGTRPYAIPLRADVGSPFVPEPKPVADEAAKTQEKLAEEKKVEEQVEADRPTPVRIDLVGITDRIVVFPVPEARYRRVAGIVGKVLLTRMPVEGALGRTPFDTQPPAKAVLEAYDFAEQKTETLIEGISDFRLDRSHHTMLVRVGNRLRVLKAGAKPNNADNGKPGRASGWVDLDRVKVSVRPGAEWRQMFREAWRLQRDHFWVEDMSGVQWKEIYDRYLPLVNRVATRSELSDLLWEFQGELGTSHAYELGGEYRPGPTYRQGSLGVDWEYDETTDRFRIAYIVTGDPWNPGATSPLNRPGVDVRVGDEVLAINGQTLGRPAPDQAPISPEEALVNLADQEVQLTVVRDGGEPRTVTVKALGDERAARYRDWVNANRALVHERTGGRVGYLHVPDMGPGGFAEFHRSYLTEFDRDGLLVDVRFNGGGHVSALLLEKLSRRRLGYDFSRWHQPEEYPAESPRGPMVALTNEHAGSDGDIFSHTFKLRGLGPLIGKRTWGGVIGITVNQTLADGTVTTQPEYSFAFDDVGWRVENYGTDPDIEVDITPQDYAAGRDTQLERAIEVALERLEAFPPHRPDPADRPRLTRPALPPRPSSAR